MSNKTIKGEIVQQYIQDNPDEFNHTLAKKIFNDNPDIFDNKEQARALIRYYKGASGDKLRKSTGIDKQGYHDIHEVMQAYKLRAEDERKENFVFDKATKDVAIISDLHIPYHLEREIGVALDYLTKKGFDTLLINGDLIDFYQVSDFSRDPSRKDVWYEMQMTMEFLGMLRDAFPDVRIYWKLGNHEKRFYRYMQTKAKELYNLPALTFEELFDLRSFNVTLIDEYQLSVLGKLSIVHGHEFGRSFFNPVNPARGLFLRSKSSTLAGHNHQTSEHHENNLRNDALACWSTGCLCSLTPDYRPFGFLKWNHGAAHVKRFSDDTFHVDNFRIIEGRIV